MARSVTIVEVGPRDGLQAEPTVLAPTARLELIAQVAAAGARRIEVASFVDPRRVPQMTGAEEICTGLSSPRTFTAIGLVLNERGLLRALDTTIEEINIVAYASDGYSRLNTGANADARNHAAAELAAEARRAGRRVTVTIAVAFGDPVDGDVPAGRVGELAAAMAEAGAHEVNLGDTIGVAVPDQVAERVTAVRRAAPGTAVRCHFHDTNHTGYANVYAALAAGVDTLDASVGGRGGSPLHPGAGGNVATEHVAWMLHRSGIDTGLDEDRLADAARWLADRLAAT